MTELEAFWGWSEKIVPIIHLTTGYRKFPGHSAENRDLAETGDSTIENVAETIVEF